MKEKITDLITAIKNKQEVLSSKKVTAGFDGFVDTIVRVIKNKENNAEPEFFNTIHDYGKYILEKSGSFSLEYEIINTKLGGNMPITSNALAQLGVTVNCIGAFGYPQIHTAFADLSPNCLLHSFTDPGTAIAFEFRDGKMIIGQAKELNSMKWNDIINVIGLDVLVNLFNECDLFCVLNWSEIDTSTNIWQGIINDILPAYQKRQKQISFFDLSDCSKRSKEIIEEMLSLLKVFSKYTKTILSLNRNEANIISKIVCNKDFANDQELLGSELYKQLGIDMLVLHSSGTSYVFSEEGINSCKSFFVEQPLISTGAGDNFNAGFIAGQLMELNAEDSLIFANATAAQYIQSGLSPQHEQMISFLEQQIKS
ncbi:carbohydrate kinase family protein [Panacibacter ginsenosidivorans]|uniref:Carbohydrate kinase family protein n=1 Tax=Panacibacter ginsenosidivorans TaxID=1813871 RepID=A0A5B8V3W9_9BACT|nr:PfkB family carbohydrate kinase [Panacibacter ginsenosidivorans]QEC65902.1 carbohydrate kinase family protein [Panacibacter ginsenosidivorans]